MGYFKDHIEFAKPTALLVALVAAALSIPYTKSLLTALSMGLVAYAVVLVGTSVPDVDHHVSKPHRWLKTVAAVIGGAGVLFYFGPALQIPTRAHPYVWLAVIFIAAITTVKHAPRVVEELRPTHRGITHTLGFGAVLCLLLAASVWYTGYVYDISHIDLLGLIVLFGVFIGIYRHLQLDDEL